MKSANSTFQNHSWVKAMQSMSRRSRVVELSLHIDGLSGNVPGWKMFSKHREGVRDLKITMLFREAVKQ